MWKKRLELIVAQEELLLGVNDFGVISYICGITDTIRKVSPVGFIWDSRIHQIYSVKEGDIICHEVNKNQYVKIYLDKLTSNQRRFSFLTDDLDWNNLVILRYCGSQ